MASKLKSPQHYQKIHQNIKKFDEEDATDSVKFKEKPKKIIFSEEKVKIKKKEKTKIDFNDDDEETDTETQEIKQETPSKSRKINFVRKFLLKL